MCSASSPSLQREVGAVTVCVTAPLPWALGSVCGIKPTPAERGGRRHLGWEMGSPPCNTLQISRDFAAQLGKHSQILACLIFTSVTAKWWYPKWIQHLLLQLGKEPTTHTKSWRSEGPWEFMFPRRPEVGWCLGYLWREVRNRTRSQGFPTFWGGWGGCQRGNLGSNEPIPRLLLSPSVR